MNDNTKALANYLWDFAQEQGGAKSALALVNRCKAPPQAPQSGKADKENTARLDKAKRG